MKSIKVIVLLVFVCWLSACGIQIRHYESGFETELAPSYDRSRVWVATPTMASAVLDAGDEDSMQMMCRQMQVNLVQELAQKTFLDTYGGSTAAPGTDYRLRLHFSQYRLVAQPSGLMEMVMACEYAATLSVEDRAANVVFKGQASQQGEYHHTTAKQQQYLPKADDKCFQARSRVVETLLNDFLSTLTP